MTQSLGFFLRHTSRMILSVCVYRLVGVDTYLVLTISYVGKVNTQQIMVENIYLGFGTKNDVAMAKPSRE